MIKAYKYRLYPTPAQEQKLEFTVEICRELYNVAIEERRSAYKSHRLSITYTYQQNQLPEIKKERLDVGLVHSQVLQDVLRRVDKSFNGFFRRLAKGERAGYPRFVRHSKLSVRSGIEPDSTLKRFRPFVPT
jgi:putative transposase